MGSRIRSAASVAVAAVLCALVAVLAPAAGASTVLFVGGTGGTIGALVPDEVFGSPESFLGGAFIGHTFDPVDYPGSLWPLTGPCDPTLGSSVRAGVDALLAAAKSTPGPLVVAGVSQGAMVVQEAQRRLNTDPTVASETTFILIADPDLGIARGLSGVYLPILDYVPQPPSPTRFTTIVIRNQYDPFADPVTRPWNLLADANALMALLYVHPFAQNTDLSKVPPQNIVTAPPNSQGGVTTTYFVPTQELPLTMPLRQLGVRTDWVDGIDDVLRPLIDVGYVRNSYAVAAARPKALSGRGSHRPTAERTSAAAPLRGSSSPPAAAGTSGPRSPKR